MDSTKNFNGLANEYQIGRPVYANELIKEMYSTYRCSEESVIADIGSGTGKFAKQLLEKGSFVYCVEPNDDMRNTAIEELKLYKKFCAISGTAVETMLPDNSVDYITVAQAFHWFDVSQFKKECKRILKDKGLIFLIWNMRDMSSELNRISYEIYSKYCPNFKGFGGGIQKNDVRIQEFFESGYKYVEFDNPLIYTKEKFICRCLSGSYSLKNGDENYDMYIGELSELFEQYSENDILTMENKTVVYFGNI